MPRKPGGKYKGKVGRAKGEQTIAAELETKRRKAYEANLRKLQERRVQDLLAANGMQSSEEEAQAIKMARIAQLFGQGKKGTLTKFWKNWKIGVIQTKKEQALYERKTCWRKSCDFCAPMSVDTDHRYGEFNDGHMGGCKSWWKTTLGHDHWGDYLDAAAAKKDRPDVVNDHRQCCCCGVDAGFPGGGCRCYMRLRDRGFVNPSDADKMKKTAQFQDSGPSSTMSTMATMASRMFGMTSRSASSPSLTSPTRKQTRLTLSVEDNWTQLRHSGSQAGIGTVPEYDPSAPFALSPKQMLEEDRRLWSDELSAMAGSPMARKRSGHVGLPALTPEKTQRQRWTQDAVPDRDDQGRRLEESTHWRTGQKTMLNSHMMKMYVVGVQ